MLELCEGLFLDLANLNVEPVDPEQCEAFRRNWSGIFRECLETEDDVLIALRQMVHEALRFRDAKRFEALALRFGNLPALSGKTYGTVDLPYPQKGVPSALFPRRGKNGFLVQPLEVMTLKASRMRLPKLFDMPRALAAAILSFTGKGLRLVRCEHCERCAIGRSNQRFCPGGVCRRAWHQAQPATKEKRRKYMRKKMREYRRQERRRNRTNLRLARRPHAKAT
jgi:hypothetical protein